MAPSLQYFAGDSLRRYSFGCGEGVALYLGGPSMKLSDTERGILRIHRGNTAESQAIRKRLFRHGLKYCGICDSIKSVSAFGRDRRTLHGRWRTLGGLASTCRPCNNRGKPRARTNIVHFNFTGPDRNARYRDRMSPAELRAYQAKGHAQGSRSRRKQRYRARLALGMTRLQAEYREPWDSYADVWQEWLETNPPRDSA